MTANILVVDDEKEIADLVELYLANEGYTVSKFYSPEKALEHLENNTPDLALLDVMMPGIDGFELCRRIRTTHNYPIIMLTAKVEDIDKIAGLAIGADDYVTKPFNPLEVVARVKAQLRRVQRYSSPKDESEDVLDFDGLVINRKTHECSYNEQAISLTPTEFSILWFLCENRGQVISSVVGYLTLLRDEPDISPEMRMKYTGISLEKALRLEELINEFFDITRFNLQDITLEKSRFDLSMMVIQITDEFYPSFMKKNVTCTLDVDERLIIEADSDKLSRVFDNLLKNALSYSDPDSPLLISVHRVYDNAVIRVTNHGADIPTHKLSMIFERFYRLDSARSANTGGAGLGLAIAKEITELHGGTITAESGDGLTSFIITLPI